MLLIAPKPAPIECGNDILRLNVALNGDKLIFHSEIERFEVNHNFVDVCAISEAGPAPGTDNDVVVLAVTL